MRGASQPLACRHETADHVNPLKDKTVGSLLLRLRGIADFGPAASLGAIL